jgi:hypothetical protein
MKRTSSAILTIDQTLAHCLLICARRGAQIRAELRAQYGIEEGDRRMSELAREAERKLWVDTDTTPTEILSGELVAEVHTLHAEASEHGQHSTPC